MSTTTGTPMSTRAGQFVSTRSGLYAGLTLGLMMLVLGNGWVVDRLRSGEYGLKPRTAVAEQLEWQLWRLDSDFRSFALLRLILLIVLTVGLGAIVGRARPAAAFVGGWAIFLFASIVSSGLAGETVKEGMMAQQGMDPVDQFSHIGQTGTSLGVGLGWLIGLAVLYGSPEWSRPTPATDLDRSQAAAPPHSVAGDPR
jgi:hypothetical protein